MSNMFTTKRTITANKDIAPRFAKNFVAKITHIKSNVYFIMENREINAKSILGIISINIMNGDRFDVCIDSSISQECAENDMDKVIELLMGD